MKNEFYLRDSRSNTGSCCMFWANSGYTTDLNKAVVYSREEAQKQANCRETDIPLSKSHVDKLTAASVDMQYLDKKGGSDKNGEYVIIRNGEYDGNNVYFQTKLWTSPNYHKARIYNSADILSMHEFFLPEELARYSIYPKSFIDTICRKTFAHNRVNKRTMTQGAGIKMPKVKRQRQATGKTRHNCSTCGKIVWEYDPYTTPKCYDCDWENRLN